MRIFTAFLVACMLGCVSADAQNIFSSIRAKMSSIRQSLASDRPADKPEEDAEASLSVEERSLDGNLMTPQVPQKVHDALVSYINDLAKRLSVRRVERIELMRDGEVIVATIGAELLFAPNDTVLRPTASNLLKPYAALLDNPGYYKMIVVGHTDNTGTESYTDMMSEERAGAVAEWLVRHAKDGSDILVYGLGATSPRGPNNSMSNRAANRRIEIYIVPDKGLIDMIKNDKLQHKK